MKELMIEGTKFSPKVELHPNGYMLFEGRSIVEDSIAFFAPIFRWIKMVNVSTMKVDIKLEYMNTASAKQIYSMLMFVKENYSIKDVYVNWYYEEGDEDSFELGKDFEDQLRIPFDFYELAEISA